MEIAVGFNSLTTTTHPQNVNVPSSGKQVTTRLSARKVSIAGGTGPKTPWSGTLQNTHTHTHTHTSINVHYCSYINWSCQNLSQRVS